MTNPPHGGSVTPAAPTTGSSGSTDFGATTLSGRSPSNREDAPVGTITDSDRDPSTPERAPDRSRERSGDQRGLAGLAGASAPATTAAPGAASVPASAQTRSDLPPVPPAGSAVTFDAPATQASDRPANQPTPPGGAPAAAAPSGIRGIRTGRNRGPRRARLQIRHINPVTVLKFSCVLSIALFFVWLIVIGVLFGVLDGAGVIGNINDTVTQLNGAGSKPPVTPGIVFGGAAIIGVINIVLFIALSTIGSVIYNLCADLVGGIEITLSER